MKHLALFAAAALCAAMCQEEVDNEEFKTWSKCKAGAWVKMKMVTEASGMKTDSEVTTKLLELGKDKAVLETKTSMVVAGNKFDGPAQKRDVPAKVKKQEGTADKKPEMKEGDEEIEVGGKKVKCHWVSTKQDKTTTKIWQCKDIPGGRAKMESETEGISKMTMWAEEWKTE